MATSCSSDDQRPRPRNSCQEALAWAASALRSERVFGALRRGHDEDDAR